MGFIYKIVCNITDECYYGKSKGGYSRLNCHRGRNNKTTSRQIIDRGNYTYSIVECDLDDSLLKEREYFYITNNVCVNKTIPYTEEDSKEVRHRQEEINRYNLNPDIYKKKSSDRYYANHAVMRIERNQKINCECGKVYSKGNKARHYKTH